MNYSIEWDGPGERDREDCEHRERVTPLAAGIAQMVTEWVDGGISGGTDWRPSLAAVIDRRLARYISADKIATILSEDASLMNGNLNVGFLAVKIAETMEGKPYRET